jgi:hypothetical protein
VSEPTAGQMVAKAFGCSVWVSRDGKTTRGVEPQWHREKWPHITAEEMAAIPDETQMPKKKKGRK